MKKLTVLFVVLLAAALMLIMPGCDDGTTDGGNPAVADYTVKASNGVLHKVNTTIILFDFGAYSVPRNELLLADLEITGGTGSIDMTNLSNSPGPTRMLTVVVNEEGSITLRISRNGISAAEKTVDVYKKLGYQEDDTVVIGDIVKFGTPAADPNVSFAQYDGDPIAVLSPATLEPVSSISAASPIINHVLAEFSEPVDLTDATLGAAKLRWFDLSWDNFGSSWEFENESGNSTYTGKNWDLHKVRFQLDLYNDEATPQRIRFQADSGTNTSTGEKSPIRFTQNDIQTGSGNTAWGAGHKITRVELRVVWVQLRSPQNNAWVEISTDRNPNFVDMYIRYLTMDIAQPPEPKILYSSATGWASEIKNPKWGYEDADITPPANSAAHPIPAIPAQDGRQNTISWDPIDITTTSTAPYSTIVVTTSTPASWPWYGYGAISYNGDTRAKNMDYDSGGVFFDGSMYLSMTVGGTGAFYPGKFAGFFIQGNTAVTEITITEIRIE